VLFPVIVCAFSVRFLCVFVRFVYQFEISNQRMGYNIGPIHVFIQFLVHLVSYDVTILNVVVPCAFCVFEWCDYRAYLPGSESKAFEQRC
jgi:hypothetical protein